MPFAVRLYSYRCTEDFKMWSEQQSRHSTDFVSLSTCLFSPCFDVIGASQCSGDTGTLTSKIRRPSPPRLNTAKGSQKMLRAEKARSRTLR